MDYPTRAGELERVTGDMPRIVAPPAAKTGYDCLLCHDMHFVRHDVPVGHPDFGKAFPCHCKQQAQATRERSRAYSECYTWLGGDAGDLGRMTFERNPAGERFDSQRCPKAYVVMRQLANDFLAGKRDLPNAFFIGGVGLAKTHLACSVLNELREAGISCLYCTAQGFFNALYAAMKDDERGDRLQEQFCTTPLIVLDEIDKLRVNGKDAGESYQKSLLCELLDRRYRSHLPTIIISNETGSLDRWLEPSILDRLYAHCIPLSSTTMSGASYRQKGRAR